MILHWPLAPEYRRITQVFGANPADYAAYGLAGHEGIDLSCPVGAPVMAAHAGRVAVMWAPSSYGRYIEVEGDGVMTLYAHLSRALCDGEIVQAGAIIGYSGNTGSSTGPHLHFGACPLPRNLGDGYKGWVDPMPLLQERERIMENARAEATAVRFEIEVIVRLRQEAKQHRNQAAEEEMMATRCNNQADMREAALVNTKNGRAYRIEGILGGELPKGWEG